MKMDGQVCPPPGLPITLPRVAQLLYLPTHSISHSSSWEAFDQATTPPEPPVINSSAKVGKILADERLEEQGATNKHEHLVHRLSLSLPAAGTGPYPRRIPDHEAHTPHRGLGRRERKPVSTRRIGKWGLHARGFEVRALAL